ncbi:L-threonylcarbamoyladenylate synthase [Lentibacillus sediminis]|uniref:L-threonylcarbamoyladenylate synthase n=1 Tax=Lentibacillus sediminis TaxID=1940529 RepID=UPI000C1B9135|nr:L-threonylcarbamoyladenylate synthase [Lentibacillus sediminis]
METTRWKLTNDAKIDAEAIHSAAELLLNGETVAFPTETVYGLGADATNEAAVAKIFQAKGRPQDNPLIAHVDSSAQLWRIVDYAPEYVEKLIEALSPGPVTYVLPSNGTCASNVTANLSTIAVRIPDHPAAQQLLQTCNIPIAAPSANISGRPSPTAAAHVWEDLQGKIAGLLDGGPTGVGVESTVIDCTQDIPIILRPGGVTREQLESLTGKAIIDPALAGEAAAPKSPGMKYRHYSPDVPLWLVEGNTEKLQQIISAEQHKGKRVGLLASTDTAAQLQADAKLSLGRDASEIAANLYESLRHFKSGEVDVIICEAIPQTGIGEAVMNRLKKAASMHLTE